MKNRRFQIWFYSVSLGKLLLRSVDQDKNIDIYFMDLKYLELPGVLNGITILEPQPEDIEYLSAKTNVKNQKITVLLSEGKRYYVVSGVKAKVMENHLEMFELPFEDVRWKYTIY